ncbi:hypothetical protein KOAAANKH_00118 [Brevundimonas sp. NIBR10]|uniref:hypothetical protein n=1 Tax=Brevundimonas sp. NIBR10 TaxID=3015997 RepID=UPI0022F1B83A|nr:hypothetical protein [Brevundimonas sp. NIBR10]WGM45257.1 hypothetical protein KOAAANKH_00118 [Brevundimonas sp. NIBR10]
MKPHPFTPEDAAVWTLLADRAAIAARAPADKAQTGLAGVTGKAKRTPVAGVLNKENPCVVLVGLCRRYLNETTRGRVALQAELAEAAEAVRAALAAASGRFRRDIDG